MKLKYLLCVYLGLMGIFFSCQKGEEIVKPAEKKIVRLALQGYVMQDTLEFLKEGKVICEAYETNFNMTTPEGRPTVSATELQVRKKGSTTVFDTLSIKGEPFDQVIKIFYDGNVITDNIEITPVSSPDKVGMRVSLQANSTYMTAGPVDVEIFLRADILDSVDFSVRTEFTSMGTLKNVGADFGDFMELPAITYDDPWVSKSYVFKIYQAGTKNYPFKDDVLFNEPVENIYGSLFLSDGQSSLFQISTSFTESTFDYYNVDDIALYFQ